MRKVTAGLSATVLGLGLMAPAANAEQGRVAAAPTAQGAGSAATGSAVPGKVVWKRCKAPLKKLECATLAVPLDHAKPAGRQITLALTRKKHTTPASKYQGILLVNPGGPGGSGRELAGIFRKTAAEKAAAGYDVIGFDPRGVGASRPQLKCLPKHRKALPDPVPANARQEKFWLNRAKRIARACEKSFGWLLPHMRTEDHARDMDAIRAALGEEKINYLGYSWGTSLGMTYATLFPKRVRRMILDSVVHPTRGGYRSNLDQNKAFQKRMEDFFAWIGEHESEYGLGASADEVAETYRDLRARLKAKPLSGKIGPWELDEMFINGGYTSELWAPLAKALSGYKDGEAAGLGFLWGILSEEAAQGTEVYLATGCTDSPWPRDWATWRRDNRASHRVAPFLTWSNAWLNAPCAFWPVKAEAPLKLSGRGLPPILMLQSSHDAATPYAGALAAHRLLPSSRLILEKGGGNHAISLSGNKCLDRRVAAYLATGEVPPNRPGPDATCAPLPAPKAS